MKRSLYAFAALLLLPFITVWSCMSWLLGQSGRFAGLVSLLAVVTLAGICIFHENIMIYDLPAAFAVALVLLLTTLPKSFLFHGTLVVAFVSYAITRHRLSFASSSTPTLDALIVCSCVGVAWTFACAQSLWIPANEADLHQSEAAVYKATLKTAPYHMKVVAGLGTVHVPYTGVRDLSSPPLNVVLVHGFAGGNALWAASLAPLAQHFHVFAVEWLGVGRSHRPRTSFKSYEEADAFFVQSLELWRSAMQLDSIVLCGHSMGGMFATHYALLYPQRIQQLVLISPCGLPDVEHDPHWLIDWLWKLQLTPMDLVRNAGPFGPRLMRFILTARLSRQPESNAIKRGVLDMELMVKYNYHNWAGKRSGEVAMYTHLLPRAYAKRPLKHMLVPSRLQMPISFIYGEDGNDWMNSSHAAKVIPGLTQHTVLHKVPSAGHQVFMDNPEGFNEALISSIHAAAKASFKE
ncbi:hypothetical protein, variant 1 [Aphanomyces invadans]|uniref:AB hydrolase-1 domain-containing protein n=1 Tax=Aphanomyces invadans TaxID=157072 RepID=A0A024TRJ0_9STRA|nr:hypothetical protein, variant 1 [Aphanomyces invadans]ETV95922.1 hypothetical protein, variant 1 [Aphanomyces invadans]|eukprot:XP_008875233.1 hypothetical protein, variant 1 [Aphanomyces invadans]